MGDLYIPISGEDELFLDRTGVEYKPIEKDSRIIKHALKANKYYREGYFSILARGPKAMVITKDKFGYYLVYASNIYKDFKPGTSTSLDKQQCFLNKLLERNSGYREGVFEVIGDYKNNSTKIQLLTKYGVCSVLPSNILAGKSPTISSADDKLKYLENQFRETHGNKYSYNLSGFKRYKNKVSIKCNKCDEGFRQEAYSHMIGRGCPYCAQDIRSLNGYGWTLDYWTEVGLKSESFDSFKFYIIRCFNDNESFLKVGITFKKINKRFKIYNMPYEYEVVNYVSHEDPKFVWDMEDACKEQNSDNRYKPKVGFDGKSECFTSVSFEYEGEKYEYKS